MRGAYCAGFCGWQPFMWAERLCSDFRDVLASGTFHGAAASPDSCGRHPTVWYSFDRSACRRSRAGFVTRCTRGTDTVPPCRECWPCQHVCCATWCNSKRLCRLRAVPGGQRRERRANGGCQANRGKRGHAEPRTTTKRKRIAWMDPRCDRKRATGRRHAQMHGKRCDRRRPRRRGHGLTLARTHTHTQRRDKLQGHSCA